MNQPQVDARATKLVTFWVAGQRFGADIGRVKETLVVRPITRLPLVPPWLSGIINLRGELVAVFDLAAFIGLGRTAITPETRIVLAHRDGKKTAGLLVDGLAEVRVLDEAALQPAPSTLPPEGAALLVGVMTLDGGAPLLVLDFMKLFDSERLRQFERRA